MKSILFALWLVAGAASAGGYSYDWETGNSYNTINNFDGSTTVYGSNAGTGSNWTTTIQPNGNMRGTDSNFNSWTYDSGSGAYYNYGTGQSCYGKGALRSCY